jgi:hypothetical protein
MKKPPFLMHPEHPRWAEFIVKLYKAIDFELKEQEELEWTSKCTPGSCQNAHKILKEMGADADASIANFNNHGGGCDCEIIVNMDLFPNAEAEIASWN